MNLNVSHHVSLNRLYLTDRESPEASVCRHQRCVESVALSVSLYVRQNRVCSFVEVHTGNITRRVYLSQVFG